MRSSDVAQAIVDCIAMDKPLMLWGAPGVGKSDSVRQAAQSLKVSLIDYRVALRDRVDIIGLPYIQDGQTCYSLPAEMPREGTGILFLDELLRADFQTQGPLYQLVLDRQIGSYRLPKGWFIVAAGNRITDRGGDSRMADALADRFFHVDYEPHLGDWTKWALNNNIRPEVIAFLRFRQGLLHNHDTARKCHAFSTPRGWADVSIVLDRQSRVEGELIRGRVGDGACGEFLAFLKLYREMVSPDQILQNPLKTDVPVNSGVLYALAEALARRSTLKNFDAVMSYAERMPPEYRQCLVSSATQITPELCNTPEFIRYASSQS